LPKLITPIDDTIRTSRTIATVATIIADIDFTSLLQIDLTVTDPVITAITTIIIRIPEIYALFAKSQIAVPRSIRKRNKKQKRHDLGLRTSVDLLTRPVDPVTSKNALLVLIYSIWPESKVKMIIRAVKIN
jgi:hypothetical protein